MELIRTCADLAREINRRETHGERREARCGARRISL
jgi:hypothetical protein